MQNTVTTGCAYFVLPHELTLPTWLVCVQVSVTRQSSQLAPTCSVAAQIIKNSWSENFANAGYINVARGHKCASMCSSAGICGHLFTAGDPALYYEGSDSQ